VTTFQAYSSNDSTVSIHNWKEIGNFEGDLSENGVTMTNVRGDYTKMNEYFFAKANLPPADREIGTCDDSKTERTF